MAKILVKVNEVSPVFYIVNISTRSYLLSWRTLLVQNFNSCLQSPMQDYSKHDSICIRSILGCSPSVVTDVLRENMCSGTDRRLGYKWQLTLNILNIQLLKYSTRILENMYCQYSILWQKLWISSKELCVVKIGHWVNMCCRADTRFG